MPWKLHRILDGINRILEFDIRLILSFVYITAVHVGISFHLSNSIFTHSTFDERERNSGQAKVERKVSNRVTDHTHTERERLQSERERERERVEIFIKKFFKKKIQSESVCVRERVEIL